MSNGQARDPKISQTFSLRMSTIDRFDQACTLFKIESKSDVVEVLLKEWIARTIMNNLLSEDRVYKVLDDLSK